MFLKLNLLKYFITLFACISSVSAVTMQQFETSLDMMRNGCAPKFKIPVEILDRLRGGEFTANDNNELKVTKKGEFSIPKALAQIPIILPPEIQDVAKEALNSCKDVQKAYKDSCERVYYTTKCVRDYSPESFKFP